MPIHSFYLSASHLENWFLMPDCGCKLGADILLNIFYCAGTKVNCATIFTSCAGMMKVFSHNHMPEARKSGLISVLASVKPLNRILKVRIRMYHRRRLIIASRLILEIKPGVTTLASNCLF